MPFTIFLRSPGRQAWLQIEEGIWRTPPGHCIERTYEGGRGMWKGMNGQIEREREETSEKRFLVYKAHWIAYSWDRYKRVLYWSKMVIRSSGSQGEFVFLVLCIYLGEKLKKGKLFKYSSYIQQNFSVVSQLFWRASLRGKEKRNVCAAVN